jgi:arylsulfatase A-like enzyme/Tfp pilus assembly protein PilF
MLVHSAALHLAVFVRSRIPQSASPSISIWIIEAPVKNSVRLAIGAFVLMAMTAALLFWNRGGVRGPRPNILFITLDTTRADRIGAYGYDKARTPVLDQLAREGVLFERAISPAPLTLPVHACLFTGLYPPEHGLRTNGYGKLPAEPTTLAEILTEEGYDTAAFVASFVLDRKFGLNRGFGTYDDDLSGARPTQDAIHRFRDGRLVVDSALEWLTQSRTNPFFCWVHLYDPHAPYEQHPAEFGDAFAASAYDGEIAYTDQQVGRLVEFLKQHPETIVVIVGDHGESLGDHFELQHGYTLYDSTQRVPLIVRGVEGTAPGTRVSTSVSLVDVLPTLLEVLKQPALDKISGRSFVDGLMNRPMASRLCYGGTDDPFLQNGWSPLRSLTSDEWRYIRTTKPELYHLPTDPTELNNLAATDPERALELEQQLSDLESSLAVGEAADVQLSGAEQKALASLGYVGGSTRDEAPVDNNLPDVKDMLPFNMATQSAIDLIDQGKLAEAETILVKIVSESPIEHVSSRLYLASVLDRKGQPSAAEELYQAVLKFRPEDQTALFQLGTMYADQGKFEEAIPIFEKCLELEPEATEPLFNLGLTRARIGDASSAERIFRSVLQIDPMFPGVWVALGTLMDQQGRAGEATAAFESELRINPESVEANTNLGVQLASEQRFEEARNRLRIAVSVAPERTDARVNLAICEEMLRNYDEAILQMNEAIRVQPEAPALHLTLGNILVKASQPTKAIEEYERALQGAPENIEILQKLAALHVAQSAPVKATECLQQILKLDPGNAPAAAELKRLATQQ